MIVCPWLFVAVQLYCNFRLCCSYFFSKFCALKSGVRLIYGCRLYTEVYGKLNFNEHINDACNKASQRVGVIMRLRNLIPTTAKLVLLKSAILPYLTYCLLVWHFCRASDTRRLERIQERGLRDVYKDTKSSYHQLLNRANLPTLPTDVFKTYVY